MAQIPTPRSYSQISGRMINALLARLGLSAMEPGDPSISIIEAAARSDLRNDSDIFQFLASIVLDRAKGLALDRIGADENTPRIRQAAANGRVTITDTRYTKKSSRVYQGGVVPVLGSTILTIEDASGWTATGNLYIGRGTVNYEGPIAYTGLVLDGSGNFWTATLSSPTQKYHNLGEEVTFAQGGDRLITPGTIAQTPQGNGSTAVSFKTLFSATIPDGEVTVTNVPVSATVLGVVGNVPAGGISVFPNLPFAGAAVTNPLPFTNGLATENDDSYRERIRTARKTRAKGTALAIRFGVTGAFSEEENRSVVSSSVVRRSGLTTVYIDDGTGYEMLSYGVPFEVLLDSASGGEKFLSLSQRPVAKAEVRSGSVGPFDMTGLGRLSAKIGGVQYDHDFSGSDFRSSASASAYEIADSINRNANIKFLARVVESGTRVAIFGKDDTNEDVQVVSPNSAYIDANGVLAFATNKALTLFLYKNDVLLTKDGSPATVLSKAQSQWGAVSNGSTLNLTVDGIVLPSTITTFYDIDFVNAGTAYSTVNETNSLESWAAVFNYKIPGITASVAGGSLQIASNVGRSSRASIEISGGTLGLALFGIVASVGSDNDYSLNRNTGQIELNIEATAGDRITAGSYFTRSFVQSANLAAGLTVAADVTNSGADSGAELWLSVDGSAYGVTTGLGAGSTIVVSVSATPSWGKRVRMTVTGNSFAGVTPGEYLIVQDSAFDVTSRGVFPIVNSSATWIEIEQPASWSNTGTIVLATGAFKIVGTATQPQRVYIPAASNYTPSSLAALFSLVGADIEIYRTSYLRLRTDSYAGDIAVLSTNTQGALFGFPVLSSEVSSAGKAFVQSKTQLGTPSFAVAPITAVTSDTQATVTGLSSGLWVQGLRPLSDSTSQNRYGNYQYGSSISLVNAGVVTFRNAVLQDWLVGDRMTSVAPYALSARDTLSFTVDGTLSYNPPLYRNVKPSTSTYSTSNDLKDVDNSNLSLAKLFGLDFDWNDFAVMMKARTKTHTSPDTTKTGLWRFWRHGAEGNFARMAYAYPVAPDSGVEVVVDPQSSGTYSNIYVRLPSGPAISTPSIRPTSSFVGLSQTAGPVGGLYTYTATFNLAVASAEREIRINYISRNSTAYAAAATVTGSISGATATVVSDSVAGGSPAATGYVVVTGVVGTFLANETITAGGASATSSSSASGHTTLTLTPAPGIGEHGFQVGDAFWLQSTSGSFTTGVKGVVGQTTTTVTYIDVATTTGPTPNIGSASKDSAGEVTINGSSVGVGDIVRFGTLPGKILTIEPSGRYLTFQLPGNIPYFGMNWIALTSSAGLNLEFYPIDTSANTIAQIVVAANALSNSPLSAVAVGNGVSTSGQIASASYEASELGGTDPWYYLTDGVNWVRSFTAPVSTAFDYSFVFKEPVTATLATNSDWSNENVRLVPTTAKNVADMLTVPASGAIATVAVAGVAHNGVQISSRSVGGSSSISVAGGLANSSAAIVNGSAVLASTGSYATILTTQSLGLTGGAWVDVINSLPIRKTAINSTTKLVSIDPTGVVTFETGGDKAWTWANTAAGAIVDSAWQVEKHGSLVAFTDAFAVGLTVAGVSEGDWVIVDTASSVPTGATQVSTQNRGTFRVVRTGTGIFWIENASAIEEIAGCTLRFIKFQSVMPGDKVVIGSSVWGIDNQGSWIVESIDSTNQWIFTLSTSSRVPTAQGSVAALGSLSSTVAVFESTPSKLIKQILSITPDGANSIVKFSTSAGYAGISEAFGSSVQSRDKLAFTTDNKIGSDGYGFYTGLTSEVNKIIYGDEQDTGSYPGIAAAGANITVTGPIVKRITAAFSVRTRTGATPSDVGNRCRSVVAAVVNQYPVGTSIAISRLVTAIQGVTGVAAVTVLSPTYSVGNDLIPVQPFEKPLILDLDNDIQITFTGE